MIEGHMIDMMLQTYERHRNQEQKIPVNPCETQLGLVGNVFMCGVGSNTDRTDIFQHVTNIKVLNFRTIKYSGTPRMCIYLILVCQAKTHFFLKFPDRTDIL